MTNLVDSNVFVRSVVLSLDYFKRSSRDEFLGLNQNPSVSTTVKQSSMSSDSYKFGSIPNFLNKEDDEFCKITAFVSHNTLRLLRDLMCAVQLSDINQVTIRTGIESLLACMYCLDSIKDQDLISTAFLVTNFMVLKHTVGRFYIETQPFVLVTWDIGARRVSSH